METISLIYIDDMMDLKLSRYLSYYSYEGIDLAYKELRFNPEHSYENLLESQEIIDSNVIVIDSKLFENDNAVEGKFTGEEFEMILRRLRPYIEVIVITQNAIEPGFDKVPKWRSSDQDGGSKWRDHYDKKLRPRLNSAIEKILQFRVLAEKFIVEETKGAIVSDVAQSISDSLRGAFEYDMLSSEKIDELIDAFENVRKEIDDQRL